MRKLLFLMRKEFIQFKRSKAMVAITFGVPVVQLVLLGFAISGDIENIPTVIVDLDHSKTSREIAEKMENSDYLDVRRYETDMRETVRLMKEDDIIIAVTIPQDFERKLLRGEQPALSISADAQNTTVAITGVGYVRRIMQSMAERRIPQSGLPNLNRIIIAPRIRYNEELKNVFYMVPGIIVLLATIITIFLTALAIVRERELGTLEQLMVTPISRRTLILGKTIPYAILAFIEMCLALTVGILVYRLQIVGSLPLFFALSLLFIFCTLGVGILISTMTHTQQQALFTAWFFMVFFILMSGFFLPLENMPKAALYATYINPLRYFLAIVRDIFLKGAGAGELYKEIAALAVLAVTVNILAILQFNKRLD